MCREWAVAGVGAGVEDEAGEDTTHTGDGECAEGGLMSADWLSGRGGFR